MSAYSRGKLKGGRVALRLIEAGADVRHIRAVDEMTALKFAVHTCPAAIIQALIDHGAEVDGPPGTEQTALMIAARANHVEALKTLLHNSADPSTCCKLPWAAGRTAEGLAELGGRRTCTEYPPGRRSGPRSAVSESCGCAAGKLGIMPPGMSFTR